MTIISEEDEPCSCPECCPFVPEDMEEDDEPENDNGHFSRRDIVARMDKVGFRFVGEGMFRTVYRRGNIVVKVPRCQDGVIDNRTEARAWKLFRDKATTFGIYLAPCRLLSNDCLMMVLVDTDVDDEMKSDYEWVRQIDCMQVGMYKGRLVAYDYALDVLERKRWEKEWGTYSRFFHQNRLPYLQSIVPREVFDAAD